MDSWLAPTQLELRVAWKGIAVTSRIVAHFDGKVIVPDEAVDLPINQPLEVELRTLAAAHGRAEPDETLDRLRKLDAATGILTGPSLTDESLRRESLYE